MPFLALLLLLALLTALLLSLIAVLAKCFVHQFLLLTQDLAKFVHLLLGSALLLALLALLRLRHLQIVHHFIELGQQVHGLLCRTLLGQFFQPFKHLVERALV